MGTQKPAYVLPMLMQAAKELPDPERWQYEIKWDGFRLIAVKRAEGVQLWSRNHKNLTKRFPEIAAAVKALKVRELVMDGEAVIFGPDGRPCFEKLQEGGKGACYMAFDLMNVNGEDLRMEPIEERRKRLAKLVLGQGVMFSAEVVGPREKLVENARALGLEGLVAKRRGSRYASTGKASRDWLKVRLRCEQEFVVGGYLPPLDKPSALLVGYFDRKRLKLASVVRHGYTEQVRRALAPALRTIDAEESPFERVFAGKGGRMAEAPSRDELAVARWVRPLLVVQVEFLEWTSRGLLRQPAFKGFRTDKEAEQVRRELAPRERETARVRRPR